MSCRIVKGFEIREVRQNLEAEKNPEGSSTTVISSQPSGGEEEPSEPSSAQTGQTLDKSKNACAFFEDFNGLLIPQVL